MKLPLLGNPSFTRYWLGDTASVLAYQMLVLAVAWQIYDITNSALSLGLVGLAHFLSQALFMLAAGHVADRYDRRRIVVVCLVTQCAVLATLGAGSHAGWLTIEVIYACAFVTGIAQTFQSPALRALLPQLVAREVLPECIAWNVTVRKAAIIGCCWVRFPLICSPRSWAAPPRCCLSMPKTYWRPAPPASGCCARRPPSVQYSPRLI